MKINICDICYYLEKEKLVMAKYKTSAKDRERGLSIRVDLCEEHKDYFKDCKTFESFKKKWDEVIEKGFNFKNR